MRRGLLVYSETSTGSPLGEREERISRGQHAGMSPDDDIRSRALVAAVGLTLTVVVMTACAPTPGGTIDAETVRVPSATAPAAPTAPVPTPQSAGPKATPAGPSTAPTAAASSSRERLLRVGDRGTDVRELQRRLMSLGYWLGAPDGTYQLLTQQAVVALQKAAGLTPDGVFGALTRAALQQQVQPQPRRGVDAGVEVDLRRQLLIYALNGVPKLIVNASTGSGAKYLQDGVEQVAVTPVGRFTVFREVNGQDNGPLGSLWRPKYIVGGVAIHGYSSVPAYPASHGCIRVSTSAMDHLWNSGVLPIGTSVWVY
jgi:peptidoglycan hydrolase-like protein with peptidoglycan-binding domain